jgi:hypothetical protein
MSEYSAEAAAAFYDDYADREWTRFEDGRSSPVSFEIHRHYLHRFIRRRDRVIDVGAGRSSHGSRASFSQPRRPS